MRNNNLLILFSALCIVAILAGGITGFAIQASRASIGKLSASRQLTQEPSQLRIDTSRIAVKPALQSDSIQSRLKLKMNLADAPASKSTAYKPSGEIQGAVLYRITSNGELANYVPSKPISLMTTDSLTGNPWTDFSQANAENCITFRSDTDITIKPCRFRKYLAIYSEGAEGREEDNGLVIKFLANTIWHDVYLPKTASDKAYVGVGPYSGNSYSTYCYKNLDMLAKSEKASERWITSCDGSKPTETQTSSDEVEEVGSTEPVQSGAVLVKDVTNVVHFDTNDPFLNELKSSAYNGYKVVINAGKDEDGTRVSLGEFDFKTWTYTDFPGASASSPSILRLYFYPLDSPAIKIPAGKKMRIYYDDGSTVDTYLPEIDETSEIYVGADGSTYFDVTLTQKAAGPQQSRAMTSSRSSSALSIADLEDISASVQTIENYQIAIGKSIESYLNVVGRLEINKVEADGSKKNEYKDKNDDNQELQNQFGAAYLSFETFWTKENQVQYQLTQAGDTFTLKYDGGKTTTLSMPAITYDKQQGLIINGKNYGLIDFYISLEGNIYSDRGLTQQVGISSSESSSSEGEPTPAGAATCSDSDKDTAYLDGKNYNKYGEIIYNSEMVTFDCCSSGRYDYNCKDSGSYVVERFCTEDSFDTENYLCTNGCKAGRCLPKVESKTALICKNVDNIEGWYTPHGKLIKKEKCIGCEAVCRYADDKKEGWYNSCTNILIRQGKCKDSLFSKILKFFGFGKSKSNNQLQSEETKSRESNSESVTVCSIALGRGYRPDRTHINSAPAERIKMGDIMYQCGEGQPGGETSTGTRCNAGSGTCCSTINDNGIYEDCRQPTSNSILGKVCETNRPGGLYAPSYTAIYWHSSCLNEANPNNCINDPVMKIEDCPYGCSNGVCLSESETCSDSCLFAGERTCNSAGDVKGYNVCGNYDSDPCLEWSNFNQCESGEICSDGKCISCSDTDGGKNYERAGTIWATAGKYYDDRCENNAGVKVDQISGSGYLVEYYCISDKTVESEKIPVDNKKCTKGSLV